MTGLDSSRLRHEAVRIARSNLGYGEHNPRFLTAIGSPASYAWCAIFASYCYSRAATNLKLPEQAWCYRRKNVPEPGAKRLTKNMGKVGSIYRPYECDADQPQVGDLVCWSRGVLGWQGHVGIVTEVGSSGLYFRSIEGNVGAKVVERTHTFDEPKLWRFASLDK